MALHRNLTDPEREDFLKSNQHGILAFGGGRPYAIPMGYQYRKGSILLGFVTADGKRKMEYLKQSPRVCFTVCRPRWTTEDLKHPCTTVLAEGELEPIADRTAYDLPAISRETIARTGLQLFRIRVEDISGRQCTRQPCELFATGKDPAKEASS